MSQLSDIIRARQDDILRIWSSKAEQAAAAKGLDAPELRNMVADYIAALAEAGDELGKCTGKARALVENHLSMRIRQGFQLSEIVEEFNMLGRSISSLWIEATPQQRPGDEEIDRLYTELHLASAAVTAMFTRHMLEDEQLDKHYRLLLQGMASEALQPGAPPLSERLSEVLKLVMDATASQSAALLLCDPRTHELEMLACVGTGEEALGRHAVSLAASSFTGQIATHAQVTFVMDASTTELEVSDELRHSGIHALLGLRLRPQQTLLGILYIGLTQARTFSAREVRRLESLADQLTLHLENSRLYVAQRDNIDQLNAERALREIFVSTLAHDLRGPLTAAKLNAQRLMGTPEQPDPRQEVGRNIARNIDRADRMIRDLLDTSRIRAGELLSLDLAQCELGVIARELAQEVSATHGARFAVVAPEPTRGFWSADELRRALWNLATNAVKYGAADEPITLTVRRSGGRAQVSVHNLGPAIPAEDQQRLFDPFARARAVQTDGRRGWGLGLTLVRGCAEAHGGRVMVSSDADSGTTFTLDLPLDARPYQRVIALNGGRDSGRDSSHDVSM